MTQPHESMTELRDNWNQYYATMMDLLFEGQQLNLKLLSQIHKAALQQSKTLSDSIHRNGNGLAATHHASSNDVFKSFIDLSAMLLDSAYQTAEQSASIAKGSIANHVAKSQAVPLNGRR